MCIRDRSIFDPDKLEVSHWVSAFKVLCDELNINIKKVDTIISSIGGSKVSIKPMSTLEMEESELIEILNFEANANISGVIISYKINNILNAIGNTNEEAWFRPNHVYPELGRMLQFGVTWYFNN